MYFFDVVKRAEGRGPTEAVMTVESELTSDQPRASDRPRRVVEWL